MSFENVGLSPALQRALNEYGYERATPIQAQAIPLILERRDLVGCAQTGTGKTAAFALPTLQRLHEASTGGAKRRTGAPRALVLVPTRELAVQVQASFAKYGKFAALRSTVVYGGVSQQPQVRALQRGVDVLIATPGRLQDLMNQGFVRLDAVDMLILDEADQMLDMGFLPDLRRIVAATPAERQTLMFSATMPEEIRRLAAQWLRDPAQVQVAPASSTIDAIEQAVYFVATEHKAKMLTHYLQTTAWERTLVFVRTKHGADKVVKTLQRSGIKAAAIHGNKSQSARSKTLEHFKSQQPPVLVATDVASRGLDIRGVSHVINYELPEAPEVYVHRIGRTGRAGANGVAVALCSRDERSRLRSIERLTRKAVPVVEAPQEYACPGGHEPQPAAGSGQGGARRRPQKASRRPAPAHGGGARRTAGAQGGSGGPAGSRPPRRKRKPSVSRL